MSNARAETAKLSEQALEAVEVAGELMIRAAAALGKLSPQELEALSEATEGKLPGCIAWGLEGAAEVSKQTRESLSTHPPGGWDVRIGSGVHVGYKGTP